MHHCDGCEHILHRNERLYCNMYQIDTDVTEETPKLCPRDTGYLPEAEEPVLGVPDPSWLFINGLTKRMGTAFQHHMKLHREELIALASSEDEKEIREKEITLGFLAICNLLANAAKAFGFTQRAVHLLMKDAMEAKSVGRGDEPPDVSQGSHETFEQEQ